MEFNNTFLSWLFGAGTEEPEREEDLPALSPEERKEEIQPGSDGRHELTLPHEHAMHRLWSLRGEQAGWLPQPQLCLEGPSDPPLPDGEAKQELLRLQLFVNSTANERMNRIKARRQEKDAEQSALPDLDAHTVVFLARDGLTAWLLTYPPVGRGRESKRCASAWMRSCWTACPRRRNAIFSCFPPPGGRRL